MTQKKRVMLPAEARGLPDRQRRALGTVLSARTFKAGLEAAGIHRTTWWRWKSDPRFLAAVLAWDAASYAESLQLAKSSNLATVEKLIELRDGKNEALALQAAQALLSYSTRMAQQDDIKREVAEIRRLLGQKGKALPPATSEGGTRD
jgi:hypothetical protein